jgi:ribonuclease VapC
VSDIVLDSSALLAVILGEPGTDDILDEVAGAYISTVNLAEVYSKTRDVGLSIEEMTWAISQLRVIASPLDNEQAVTIGILREPTRHAGLSLGDRACLALALTSKMPVLTSDRDWLKCDLGLDIRVIRQLTPR